MSQDILRLLTIPLLLSAFPAMAGEAQVTKAIATPSGNAFRFDVTIAHADEGWDHYADGWQIELEDGTVLGHRKLLHPHVDEQPFTRSLGNVAVPDGVGVVYVRPHDSVHGWNDERFAITLGGR